MDNIEIASVFSNERFFDQLESRFDATIILRGNSLIVKGKPDEIEAIEKMVDELNYILKKNGSLTDQDLVSVVEVAANEEEDKKTTSKGDLVIYHGHKDKIKCRSPRQKEYYQTVLKNDVVFATGPAGTGKTFMAVAMALDSLKRNEVSRIILTRPAVEAGESLGFLPGDLNEKIDPYLRPLTDSLQSMVSPDKLKSLKERNIIEINPLAYMRGRTLNNAFIILDEAQNATTSQMKMFLTRLGHRSKAIITGDTTQIDLPRRQHSGLIEVKQILKNVDGISFIEFDKTDVVRHRLVAEIIQAYEDLEEDQYGY